MNYCRLADGAVTITLSAAELDEVGEVLFVATTGTFGNTSFDDGPVAELIELAFPTHTDEPCEHGRARHDHLDRITCVDCETEAYHSALEEGGQ